MAEVAPERPRRRAWMWAALAVVAIIAALVLAVLPLSGQVAAYQFEYGDSPTDGDILLARVQVIASAVAALTGCGLLAVSWACGGGRAIVVLATLIALGGLIYLPLLLVMFQLAF